MDKILLPILSYGIQPDLIYFLLVVPFIVMVATLARHLVGLKIFSMFVVVSMTLIISQLIQNYSWSSMGVGLGLLIFIYFFSYFVKKLVNSFSLHYYSRISLIVTMMSILLFFILMVVGRYHNAVNALNLDKMSPYAVVIAVLLSEYYSSNQTQKGYKASRTMFLHSILLSFPLGLLVSWFKFEQFMLKFPFIVILFMFVTLLIGRYKGLRLYEIKRFGGIESDEYNKE